MNTLFTFIYYTNNVIQYLNLFFIFYFTYHKASPKTNPIRDFQEDPSDVFAVKVNSFVAFTVFNTLLVVLYTIGGIYHLRVLLALLQIITFIYMIIIHISLYAEIMNIPLYTGNIDFKGIYTSTVFIQCTSYIAITLFSPSIRSSLTGLYLKLQSLIPYCDILLVFLLMIALYFTLYNIFLLAYLILGAICMNIDTTSNRRMNRALVYTKDELDQYLKKETLLVDNTALHCNPLSLIKLSIHFCLYHVRIFYLHTRYNLSYVFHSIIIALSNRLKQLLCKSSLNKFSSSCRNGIIILVLLGSMIMLYSIYEVNSVIVHFYELVSTVVIIPIILERLKRG